MHNRQLRIEVTRYLWSLVLLGVVSCLIPFGASAEDYIPGGSGGSGGSGGPGGPGGPGGQACGCTGMCLVSWDGSGPNPMQPNCNCNFIGRCDCDCTASGSICQTSPIGRLGVDSVNCRRHIDNNCCSSGQTPDYSCCDAPQLDCLPCPCDSEPVVDCAGLCGLTTAFWNSVCSWINNGGAEGSQCISTSMMGASITLCCPAGQTVTGCSPWDNGGQLNNDCKVLLSGPNCNPCLFSCMCPGISISCSGGGTVVPPTFPPVTPSVVPGTPTVIAVTPTPPPGGGQPPPNVLLRQ
jgi:hypothetical protein